MATPSQQLAARIQERLVKEGLLTEAEGKKLQAALGEGEVQAEDWRLAIEVSAEKKGGAS